MRKIIILMIIVSMITSSMGVVGSSSIGNNISIDNWMIVNRLDFNETTDPYAYFKFPLGNRYNTTCSVDDGIFNITINQTTDVGKGMRKHYYTWMHPCPEYNFTFRFRTDFNGTTSYWRFVGPSSNSTFPNRLDIDPDSINAHNINTWGDSVAIVSISEHIWYDFTILVNTTNCTNSYYLNGTYLDTTLTPPDYDDIGPFGHDIIYRHMFSYWQLQLARPGGDPHCYIEFDCMYQSIRRNLITISSPSMFVLGFDDSALTQYTIVLPDLQNKSFYDKEFAASDVLNLHNMYEPPHYRAGLMTWEQVQVLISHGWIADNHGVTHESYIDDMNLSEAIWEINECKRSILENTTQHDVWVWTAPFNHYNDTLRSYGENHSMIGRYYNPRLHTDTIYSNDTSKGNIYWLVNHSILKPGFCSFYTHQLRLPGDGWTAYDTYPSDYYNMTDALYRNGVLIVPMAFYYHVHGNKINASISNVDFQSGGYSFDITTNGFPAFIDIYDWYGNHDDYTIPIITNSGRLIRKNFTLPENKIEFFTTDGTVDITFPFKISSTMNLNLTLVEWSGTGKEFIVSGSGGSATFEISSLTSGRTYRVTRDGTGIGDYVADSGGAISFENTVWLNHTFGINLLPLTPDEQINALIPILIAATGLIVVMSVLMNGLVRPFSRMFRGNTS